jgi:serine/threonine-protein kinase
MHADRASHTARTLRVGLGERVTRVSEGEDPDASVRLRRRAQGSEPTPEQEAQGPLAPGMLLGGYRVVAPIGEGGMAIVYRGEDVRLGRDVAIKVPHRHLLNDRSVLQRFTAEAVLTAQLHHPGVVTVFDYGEHHGFPYLVMEYLRGESLAARLEREQIRPIDEALDIGIQIARTLAAAHALGVVHRDLKPQNIQLVPDPAGTGRDQVKVLDFGVAKAGSATGWPQLRTNPGDLLGTPYYMAPEHGVCAASVDARADVYALGCLLFQATCGQVPFDGDLVEILAAHATVPAPPPTTLNPAIPPALGALILRMMAKSPDLRPASMVEVARELVVIAGSRV